MSYISTVFANNDFKEKLVELATPLLLTKDLVAQADRWNKGKTNKVSYFIRTPDTTNVHINVSWGSFNFIQLELSRYPHCCGIYMLNNFHHTYISKDAFYQVMDCIFAQMNTCTDMWWNNRRLKLIMVERKRIGITDMDEDRKYCLQEIPNIENPEMEYPFFYQYFKDRALKFHEHLMYNMNSQAILHDTEVILKGN